MSNVISAQMVKTLRQSTGAGMMECKKALTESAGDFDKAIEYLRVKSGVKAQRISGREADEGRVAFYGDNARGVLAEALCETDFVARGDKFMGFCRRLAQALTECDAGDVAAVKMDNGASGEQERQELIMQVGENINFGRVQKLEAQGKIAHYTHTGDKIAAMIDYSGDDESLARDVCMHIAAMRPFYVSMDDIPADEMEKEKQIMAAQAAQSGKSPEVIEKMIIGRLRKHFAERVLLSQPFVKDSHQTVQQIIKPAGLCVHAFHWLAVAADSV